MKRLSLLLSALALIALTQGLRGSAQTNTLSVPLQAQNGSGESGSATLTQMGADVQLTIALSGAPSAAQPAHIHYGVCTDLGGVANALTSVTNGNSTTLIKGTTIAQLLSRPLAINVHESADNIAKYVACGDITAQSP